MFEKASRLKLRFSSSKGTLSTEDLWSLPLTSERGVSLNGLAQDAYQGSASSTPDFVGTAAKSDEAKLNELRLDIIKHVIAVRIAERDAAAQAQQKREQKQKIMTLIEEKQDESLRGKTAEELQALLATI